MVMDAFQIQVTLCHLDQNINIVWAGKNSRKTQTLWPWSPWMLSASHRYLGPDCPDAFQQVFAEMRLENQSWLVEMRLKRVNAEKPMRMPDCNNDLVSLFPESPQGGIPTMSGKYLLSRTYHR